MISQKLLLQSARLLSIAHVKEWLSFGWLSTTVTLIAFMVGYFWFRSSKQQPGLTVSLEGSRVLGYPDSALNEHIAITYKGIVVPRVSRSTAVIWNSGNTSFRSDDIVPHAPLVLTFSDDCQILDWRIQAVSREVTKFEVTQDRPHELRLSFYFLDPSDGARIDVVHTSAEKFPELSGTLVGLPKGVTRLAEMKNSATGFRYVFKLLITIILAVCMCVGLAGLFAVLSSLFFPVSDWWLDGMLRILAMLLLIVLGVPLLAHLSPPRALREPALVALIGEKRRAPVSLAGMDDTLGGKKFNNKNIDE
jgi:hypothetical protein